MAGKSNSQQSIFLLRGYQYFTSSALQGSSKVYDNTSKNDTVTSQQPSNTASKPKDSIRGATKPIPGAVHDQPLSSTPQRPTKVLYLNSSGLVTEYTNNLGHGSFGRVYAGTYDGSNCAVKVFAANTKLQKIEKEAEVSFLLTHNNLVQVYGLCRKDNLDCLVMERCTMNLTAYLERQRGHQLQYTVKLKLSILHQITQGMLYLHLNEIVHGDLSPGNVLLQLEGPAESPSTFIVKIADFGQSRLLNTNKNKQLTSTHGKDHFMPPEVLNASKEKYPISKSVDLFSFGCLVPYIATCMYPDLTVQAVHGSSELQKRIRHIKNRIPVLEPPEFKAACEDLMTKCLSKNPVDRPSFHHISAVLGPLVKIYVDQGYSATEEEKITEIVKLKEELQSKKDWCDQLQEEKDKIKRDCDVSQRGYQDLETECHDKTKKIAKLQKEMNSLQMQVVTMEASLKAYSGLDIGSVVGDSLKLQKESYDAVRRMEYAEERNAELKVQCQGLQEQVDGLKRKLNQTTSMKTNLEQKKTELAGEKSSLQGRLQNVEAELKTEVAQLMDETSELEKKLSAERAANLTFKKDLKKIEEARTKADLEVRKKTSVINFLKEETSRKEENFRELLSKYSTCVLEHGKENYQLIEELMERKASHEKAMAMHRTATKEKEELSRKRVKELEKKEADLTDSVASKEGVIKAQWEKFKSLNISHTKSCDKNATLEAEKKRLTEKLAEAEKVQAFEDLRKQFDELKHDRSTLEADLKDLKTEVAQLKDKKLDLEKKLSAKTGKFKELESKYKEVAEDGKELTEKLNDAKASHEKAMAMHRTATKEKEELSRKVKELEKKEADLTDSVASKEGVIKALREEIESLNISHTKSCDKNATLEAEKKRLTEKLVEAEKVQAFEDLRKQFDELKHDRSTLELKLQKTQSDYENEQKNCDRERDTTKGLRTKVAQLKDRMSSLEREVQALMDKGSHRREVMQQMVKLLQAQVAAVRSDLDQERSRQSDLKDSVGLLTRSYIVGFLKTELVSRAAELQKCRDELKTTTAERDRLRHTIAMKQYMDLRFHRLQEQMTRDLVQIVAKVIAGVHEVSAGVSELDKGVQELQDQTSSTSVQQSLTDPAPVSKNLTEDGTRTGEILCMSQPLSSLRRQSSTGEPNALVKYQPEGAKGASGQCSLPGSAMDYWQGRDSHARSTGQTSRTPLLQGEPLSDHSHSCALWSNTLVMIGFALLHSILARSKTFKQLAGNYHRSLYNLASCSYLLGAGLIWYPTPTHVMWEFPLSSDWVLQLFVAVHAISWGLVGLSLLTYNHTELLGLPQTLYGSDPLKAQGESLQRLYSHMRHPLLALPCLLLWAVPVMTLDRMLLGAFLPLYLLWGCGLDEVDSAYARRQLMRKFNKICCDVPDKDQ